LTAPNPVKKGSRSNEMAGPFFSRDPPLRTLFQTMTFLNHTTTVLSLGSKSGSTRN
jgi:hypothetical protein